MTSIDSWYDAKWRSREGEDFACKRSGVRLPARVFFSFFESFCFVSFLFSTFFYLLTGFNLFTVMLLYSFTRFCVNRSSIFAYKV